MREGGGMCVCGGGGLDGGYLERDYDGIYSPLHTFCSSMAVVNDITKLYSSLS